MDTKLSVFVWSSGKGKKSQLRLGLEVITTPVNTRANSGAGKSSLHEETGHNLK